MARLIASWGKEQIERIHSWVALNPIEMALARDFFVSLKWFQFLYDLIDWIYLARAFSESILSCVNWVFPSILFDFWHFSSVFCNIHGAICRCCSSPARVEIHQKPHIQYIRSIVNPFIIHGILKHCCVVYAYMRTVTRTGRKIARTNIWCIQLDLTCLLHFVPS